MRCLSPKEKARMNWMVAFLALPDGGVRAEFPDEIACADRLAAVRWPHGVSCVRCHSTDVGFLELRKLYHCRNCRRQFSVTSGTIAHRSRLELSFWFIAAEDIITAHAKGVADALLTGHGLADRYGISYAATYRLKQLLMRDLSVPTGLFRASVCVRGFTIPPDIASSDLDRFLWLVEQMTAPVPGYD
ncbi:transposase [uncultured Sulfitobacter sp.]|uniref:transposase n=1 Tax=Sulfitobacter sp. SH22 TaxID=3421172 RepID=UPI00345CAE61